MALGALILLLFSMVPCPPRVRTPPRFKTEQTGT